MIPDFSAPKILFYPLESVIAEKLTTIIKEIAGKELNDNVRFDTERISYGIIKEELDYQGLRFILTARLGKIR